MYRLHAFSEDSKLDDSPAISPEYCYDGTLHPYLLQENVAYPPSSELVISHKQVGAVSSLTFPGFALAIPLATGDLVHPKPQTLDPKAYTLGPQPENPKISNQKHKP